MSGKKETVCAVVVTYNRKSLLIECLEAIRKQTSPVDAIYIIDNASTDGTPELLKEKGYIQELPLTNLTEPWEKTFEIKNLTDGDRIKVHYVRMHENTGGAGGFHEGVRKAYGKKYDWLWLMDDDGCPASKCLEILIKNAKYNNLKVINPLVIDKNDKLKLSFGLSERITTVRAAVQFANSSGIILGKANPFNGTLLHKEVVKKVGFMKKEMFVWGDEIEYLMRIRNNGFLYGTTVNAYFYHPKNKAEFGTVFFGVVKIPLKPSHLEVNFYRNLGYLSRVSSNFKGCKIVVKYVLYFLSRGLLKTMWLFVKYFYDGYTNQYKLPIYINKQ